MLRRSDPLPPAAQTVHASNAWLGSAPLPARGEARAAELDDRSQVWIVRHANGAVSVLASHEVLDELGARRFSGVRGLQLPVRFRADVRRFYGIGEYDEHGASTEGTLHAALPRHVSAIEGERVLIGPRDRAALPSGIERATNALESGVEAEALPAVSLTPRVSLAHARALPVGTRVVLDASLLVTGAAAPRLCSSAKPIDECEAQSARVLDVTRVAGSAQLQDDFVVHGPLLARVAHEGFVELQIPASASYESNARDARAAPAQRDLCETEPRVEP